MPRPELECVGGPRCGDTLFAPPPGVSAVRVPADPAMEISYVRLYASLGAAAEDRVGVYLVRLRRGGELVLRWNGEE